GEREGGQGTTGCAPRAGSNRTGHDEPGRADVIQSPPTRSPTRLLPTRRREPPLSIGRVRPCDVDFRRPRLVRFVGNPSPVRRESRAGLAGLSAEPRQWPAISLERQEPDVPVVPLRRADVGKLVTVPREGLPKFHCGTFQ